jgi:hypothetical protein
MIFDVFVKSFAINKKIEISFNLLICYVDIFLIYNVYLQYLQQVNIVNYGKDKPAQVFW